MNAEDCLAGASPEVRRLTAECVKAMRPVLEGKPVRATLEAACRAAAIVATSCASDGAEYVVVRAASKIIDRLVVAPGSGKSAAEPAAPKQVLN